MGGTAVHGNHTVRAAVGLQQTSHDVQRVGAAQTNIATGVASAEVVEDHGLLHLALLGLTRSGQSHVHVETTSAADAHGVLGLGVHVDHVLRLQHSGLQLSSSVKTRLLITSDQHLQRTVLQGLVLQNGEAGGNTNTVISTQRSAGSHQPLVVHNAGSQGILAEVDLHVIVLLDHHIHVALQAHRRLIFEAWGVTRHCVQKYQDKPASGSAGFLPCPRTSLNADPRLAASRRPESSYGGISRPRRSILEEPA